MADLTFLDADITSDERAAAEETLARDRRPSSKSERKMLRRRVNILRLLAEKGPLNTYRICEHFVQGKAGSEPTILYAVRDLREMHCIRAARIDNKSRGVKPSEHYDLTLAGLLVLIKSLLDNEGGHRFLEHLATKYRNLMPSVFDVWAAIRDAGIADLAFRRLQHLCDAALLDLGSAEPTDWPTDLIREDIDTFFDPGEKRWLEGVMTNKTLRERVKESLRNAIAWREWEIEGAIEENEEAERILDALSKKD